MEINLPRARPGQRLHSSAPWTSRRPTGNYVGPPPAGLQPPEGALRELLNKTGFYSDDRPDLSSYAKESVSWPASGTSPMNLIDGLGEADRARLNDWESHMLRGPNEADEIRQRA